VTAVRAFAQTLRRYTTARAVLQNYTQINQMLTDLNRMDFRSVQQVRYFETCISYYTQYILNKLIGYKMASWDLSPFLH